jgi:hypothetical protein
MRLALAQGTQPLRDRLLGLKAKLRPDAAVGSDT